MSTFDFTALIKFLTSLFEAFMNLFAKLGFDPTEEDAEGDAEAEAEA